MSIIAYLVDLKGVNACKKDGKNEMKDVNLIVDKKEELKHGLC